MCHQRISVQRLEVARVISKHITVWRLEIANVSSEQLRGAGARAYFLPDASAATSLCVFVLPVLHPIIPTYLVAAASRLLA
jgi:hypothetical protein